MAFTQIYKYGKIVLCCEKIDYQLPDYGPTSSTYFFIVRKYNSYDWKIQYDSDLMRFFNSLF